MSAVSVTITIETPDGSTVDINPGPTGSAEPRQADPWSDGDTTTSNRGGNASTSRSGPPESNSARPASGVVTDDRGKQWTFNAAGSPDCQCGSSAALVKGKTNGKTWEQWRCAKAYDDWKNKCDFAQWA
jgi:hypothetical protein